MFFKRKEMDFYGEEVQFCNFVMNMFSALRCLTHQGNSSLYFEQLAESVMENLYKAEALRRPQGESYIPKAVVLSIFISCLVVMDAASHEYKKGFCLEVLLVFSHRTFLLRW